MVEDGLPAWVGVLLMVLITLILAGVIGSIATAVLPLQAAVDALLSDGAILTILVFILGIVVSIRTKMVEIHTKIDERQREVSRLQSKLESIEEQISGDQAD